MSGERTVEQVSKRTYRVRKGSNHPIVRNIAQDAEASLASASRPDMRARFSMLSRFATGDQRRATQEP